MSAQLVGAMAAGIGVAALILSRALRPELFTEIRIAHPEAEELRHAGWEHGLAAWEAMRAGVVATCVVAVLAFGLPLAIVLPAAAAQSVWIRLRADAARDRARRATGRIVAAAEASLRSGTSMPEALRRAAASCTEPIAAKPLLEAVRAFDLGASLDASLVSAAASSHDERARLALGTMAVGIGERLPRERLADLLAEVGDRLAFEDRLGDEVRARAAGARWQQRLLAAVVPALALYLVLTMPTLAETLGSELGRYVLIPAATVLELAGIALGRRVVRDALR